MLNKMSLKNKGQRGFTLVELMIVVAIIAVLAAVAIPSYQSSVLKSRRADSEGALQQFRQAMERHYTKVYSYTGAATGGADTGAPDPAVFASQSPVDGGTALYNLTISAANNNTYTLTATPVGGQAADACGVLTLSNAGVRGSDGAAADGCWEF